MEYSKTRREVRCDLQMPVSIAWKGLALTENISAGGLFAATTRYGHIGDQVHLRLRLPNLERWVDVSAEIRWVRTDPNPSVRHGARGMGLMFTQVPFWVAALVRQVIESAPPDSRL
jgi:Tfp pilus assembly protein PilZ